MQKTYNFKKGVIYSLDDIYKIQGVIPKEAYEQDEFTLDSHHDPDNDSGETVRFIKDVKIKINVVVT